MERRRWRRLFNGRDLKDWAPKITGYALGDNYARTFRVENGLLRVVYDGYPTFDGRFGHLFYRASFSRYRLRIEYRFVGEQVAGGPGWALRNSGVMLHSQPPETLRKDQDFPVSIEVQFLGGTGQGNRPTANLCTPGTNVVMNGQLVTRHCTDSAAPTFHGDRWVNVEVEVLGGERLRHLVDGNEVLATRSKLLTEGYLALQSESHPVEFRRVELLPL